MSRKIMIALAATALSASPVLAQAQNAQPAVAKELSRASANSEKANDLEGGSGAILGILAAAIAAVFVVITVSNDDELPTSP